MSRARNLPTQSWLVACAAAWVALSSCSGAEFTASDAAAGATSGNSGSSGTTSSAGATVINTPGGEGGEVSSGGMPTLGGKGGGGGMVTTGCDCPAGQYCREGSTDCFDCAQLNRLYFTKPMRLSAVSAPMSGARFPRVGLTSIDLVYHYDGIGNRYTSDASTSAGSGVRATEQQDTAPLLLKTEVSGSGLLTQLMSFNFVYDRPVSVGMRTLLVGEWKDGLGMIVEPLPATFNSGKGDYSMAIAAHATATAVARAFWMSGRDPAGTALLTAPLTKDATVTPVMLTIGQAKCTPQDAVLKADQDLSPWVTDDGKTLLVSTMRIDANCASANQGKEIYAVPLQPATGQPTLVASPVNDVNSAADDVDASFSADMCDLYFASNRDGKFGLYRAHRR